MTRWLDWGFFVARIRHDDWARFQATTAVAPCMTTTEVIVGDDVVPSHAGHAVDGIGEFPLSVPFASASSIDCPLPTMPARCVRRVDNVAEIARSITWPSPTTRSADAAQILCIEGNAAVSGEADRRRQGSRSPATTHYVSNGDGFAKNEIECRCVRSRPRTARKESTPRSSGTRRT